MAGFLFLLSPFLFPPHPLYRPSLCCLSLTSHFLLSITYVLSLISSSFPCSLCYLSFLFAVFLIRSLLLFHLVLFFPHLSLAFSLLPFFSSPSLLFASFTVSPIPLIFSFFFSLSLSCLTFPINSSALVRYYFLFSSFPFTPLSLSYLYSHSYIPFCLRLFLFDPVHRPFLSFFLFGFSLSSSPSFDFFTILYR